MAEMNVETDLELERFREDQKNAEREHAIRLREIELSQKNAEREHAIRNREIELKEAEARRSRWANPTLIAIIAAVLTGLVTIYVAWLNGENQNRIEATKNEALKDIEQRKVETTHILAAINETTPEKELVKLRSIIDLGLIADSNRQAKLENYIKIRQSQIAPPPTSQPTNTPIIEKYSTGWLGGGNSQDQQCRNGRLLMKDKHPGKSILLVDSSEKSKKDFLGKVEYMYFCTFQVQ